MKKEISYLEEKRIEKLCPKCLLKRKEIEMERKFELSPEDYDNDLMGTYCYQCPRCKNIEERK